MQNHAMVANEKSNKLKQNWMMLLSVTEEEISHQSFSEIGYIYTKMDTNLWLWFSKYLYDHVSRYYDLIVPLAFHKYI